MSSIDFSDIEGLIFDADCAINLASSGQFVSILSSIPCSCAISRYVHDNEVLRNNLQPYIDRGLLHVVILQAEEYDTVIQINLEVNVPNKVLGDGEIETGSIAIHRNLAIAIDDAKARSYFGRSVPKIKMLTTPELLKHWVDTSHPSNGEVALTLELVQKVGNYIIGKKHPLYTWWHTQMTWKIQETNEPYSVSSISS